MRRVGKKVGLSKKGDSFLDLHGTRNLLNMVCIPL